MWDAGEFAPDHSSENVEGLTKNSVEMRRKVPRVMKLLGWKEETAGVLTEIGEEFVRIKTWPMVVGMSSLPLICALCDVGLPQTASAGPASTTRGPSGGEGGDIECVAPHYIRVWRKVWDGMALKLFHVFLNFGGIGGWLKGKVRPCRGDDRICGKVFLTVREGLTGPEEAPFAGTPRQIAVRRGASVPDLLLRYSKCRVAIYLAWPATSHPTMWLAHLCKAPLSASNHP